MKLQRVIEYNELLVDLASAPDGDIQLVIPDDAEPPLITDYRVPWVPGREAVTRT